MRQRTTKDECRTTSAFESRHDVKLASECLAKLIPGKAVVDEKSGRDHRYIGFFLHREVEVTASQNLGKNRQPRSSRLSGSRVTKKVKTKGNN